MSDSTTPDKNRNRKLIVFFRLPEPGRVKKRLAFRVGPDAAFELYRAMLEDLGRNLKPLSDFILPMVDRPVTGSEGTCGPNIRTEAFAGKDVLFQQGRDLGERMENAFRYVFRGPDRAEKAVLIGSDIPHIRVETIVNAFELLTQKDLVLGPAADGGYYLIGFSAEVFFRCLSAVRSSGLFRSMPWGTGEVFALTAARALGLGLSIGEVSKMADLDTYEDLLQVLNSSEAERLPRLQVKASELGIGRGR